MSIGKVPSQAVSRLTLVVPWNRTVQKPVMVSECASAEWFLENSKRRFENSKRRSRTLDDALRTLDDALRTLNVVLGTLNDALGSS